MHEHEIEHWLRRGDDEARPASTSASRLIEQVHALDRRRRRRTRAIAVAAVVLAVVGGVAGWRSWEAGLIRPAPAEVVTAHSVAKLRQAIATSDSRLLVATMVARTMRKDQELREAQRSALNDPELEIELRIEEVAGQILFSGDELREANAPSAEVAAAYENVIKLFPQTISAEQARLRLATIEPPGVTPCDRM